MDPDYAIRPFDLSSATERTVGIGALVLTVAAIAVLAWGAFRRQSGLRWLPVLVALSIVGVMLRYFWRIATAAQIGANIGYGLGILMFGPVAAALLLFALGYTIATLRRGRLRQNAAS